MAALKSLSKEDLSTFVGMLGQTFDRCVSSSRPLSPKWSKHFGYGRTCAQKHGWVWNQKSETLRADGKAEVGHRTLH